MAKRVFLIVLDSFGIGAMADAAAFGDTNPNTLARIATSPYFKANTFSKLGLFNIDGVSCGEKEPFPKAAYARMRERSKGKDTTIGHWEIAGVVSDRPLPTYPQGFPQSVLDAFTAATGRAVLCNKPYSGTAVIKDYGKEHLETGALIVYTSADSVFQIAAHESIVPPETLYDYCRKAREILQGEHAVGRVIARPFEGEYPHFVRTPRRHDFSLTPPAPTMLDAIKQAGQQVIAIGKISDIFAGQGVTKSQYTASNAEGMAAALQAQKSEFAGLCFVNLVDFDMQYGHRQDIDGYAAAFAAVDDWLPTFLEGMGEEDLLLITADHGCDPGDDHTDHTREYTPLLLYGNMVKPMNFGTRDTFADIAATVTAYLGVPFDSAGRRIQYE